jgi:hypothetical protein
VTIKRIFKNDLSRRIKEVIKVDDPDLGTVAEEIEDYWVTDHIESEFIKALDRYQETILSPSEEVNVWVSGFFGSGKSSFAKILGYILSNPTLGTSSAAELFVEQLKGDRIKALLNTIHDRAPTVSVFVDLSAGAHVLREGESIVLPLYRELLSQLGYSREPRLAELEFTMVTSRSLNNSSNKPTTARCGRSAATRRSPPTRPRPRCTCCGRPSTTSRTAGPVEAPNTQNSPRTRSQREPSSCWNGAARMPSESSS